MALVCGVYTPVSFGKPGFVSLSVSVTGNSLNNYFYS
jgi:hypothetical protein